ncbi:MAG: tRNA pseudouridine(55) synthase TruB [Candidatus Omnitrophica bacterium]|nr:tRNA pseudouridine(55) synthase TruB [Candidatus Omnitrophota bacterium]
MTEGIAIIDKPSGMTSHDVVARVRRILKIKRVGHAGTLDPLATGVLVILVGKSTRLFDKFVAFDKAYSATMQLGLKTSSADINGEVLSTRPYEKVSRDMLEEAFKSFTGSIFQVPPMVSAVKHNGERLYKLARKGVAVERAPRSVRIDRLELLNFQSPFAEFILECSKGTYVRQVAEDVGELLGCGACITQIRRIKVGPFSIDKAVKLEDFNAGVLRDWPVGQNPA